MQDCSKDTYVFKKVSYKIKLKSVKFIHDISISSHHPKIISLPLQKNFFVKKISYGDILLPFIMIIILQLTL